VPTLKPNIRCQGVSVTRLTSSISLLPATLQLPDQHDLPDVVSVVQYHTRQYLADGGFVTRQRLIQTPLCETGEAFSNCSAGSKQAAYRRLPLCIVRPVARRAEGGIVLNTLACMRCSFKPAGKELLPEGDVVDCLPNGVDTRRRAPGCLSGCDTKERFLVRCERISTRSLPT